LWLPTCNALATVSHEVLSQLPHKIKIGVVGSQDPVSVPRTRNCLLVFVKGNDAHRFHLNFQDAHNFTAHAGELRAH
jgi:hypothetical protein